ncbi:CRISPR-associated endonuclease Cas9 [compost metagenome]
MHPLILALDVAGNPHQWITHEDAAYYYTKSLVAWDFGSDGCVLHGGTSRITNEQSRLALSTIIAIKGKTVRAEASARYNMPALSNKALFQRDKHLCAYCGNVFAETELTRDHVVPSSRGGPNTWNNCVTSCKRCNNVKGDRTPTEYGKELLYLPYTPNRAEYLILTNKRILADQMEFLLSKVPAHSRLLVN